MVIRRGISPFVNGCCTKQTMDKLEVGFFLEKMDMHGPLPNGNRLSDKRPPIKIAM